jgi:colicin import membrane protein
MKQSLRIGKEPNFQKVVIASAVLHLLFISLITIPIKTKEREYKSYFVNLVEPVEIRKAVKTPAIKAGQEKKGGAVKVKPIPRRRVKAKSKADISLEAPDSKVKKEIERLRALSALAKLKKKKEDDLAMAREADEAVARAIEGIRKKKLISVSKGAGIPSHVSSADSGSYYGLITKKIWSEWIPPDYDASGLEVIISIKIGKDGKVIEHEVEKSSGNIFFDRAASKAIIKASPLPTPPVEMEVGVRFYL